MLIFSSRYLRLAIPLFIVPAVSAADHYQEGIASSCVLDSQYLAQGDEQGFHFERKSKNGRLDLGTWTEGAGGASFSGTLYREGPLEALDLPLIPLPGAHGRALRDGDGEETSWNVTVYDPVTVTLFGTQEATGEKLEGLTLFGSGDSFGWQVGEKLSIDAWIFLPDAPVRELPGKTPGKVIEGRLEVGEGILSEVRLPGSDAAIPTKRVRFKFKAKSTADWKCHENKCHKSKPDGADRQAGLQPYSTSTYLYWQSGKGWVAEAVRQGQAGGKSWRWSWYSTPGGG